MVIKIYNELSTKLFSCIDKLSVFKIVIICSLITIIAFFPEIIQYRNNTNLYHSIDKEIDLPFKNESYYDLTAPSFNLHTEKRKFRLFVPIIAHILHLDAKQMIWLQFLLLPIFLFVIYKVFFKITNDHITSSLLTFAFPFFYVAESYFLVIPFYDSYGYLLLALLFLTNSNLLRYIILVAVCFCDERAIISTLLVYLSLVLYKKTDFKLKNFIYSGETTTIFTLGWLTYLIIRFILTFYFGITIPISSSHGNGLSVLLNNYTVAPLAVFLTFEGFWMLIIPAFIYLIYSKKWLQLLITIGILFCFFAVNLMVYDITRSFAYCYTFIFIALIILYKTEQIKTLRNLAFFSLIGCLIIPTMMIYSQQSVSISWLSPIFPKILKFF